MKVVTLREINYSTINNWDEAIENLGTVSLYHISGWLDYIKATYKVQELFFGIYQGDNLIGLWPGFIVHKGPLKIYGSPLTGWFTQYMGYIGPLFSQSDQKALVDQFLLFMKKYKIHYLELCDLKLDKKLMEQKGFQCETKNNFILDIVKNEQAMFTHLHYNCRKHIKKAIKFGVTTIIRNNKEYINTLYAMIEEVFARRHLIPTFTKRSLFVMWDKLYPKNKLIMIDAQLNGQSIAGFLCAYDKHTIHALAAGTKQAYRKHCATHLLHWEAIKFAIRNNISYFDFRGGTSGGVGKFKASFNPKLINLCYYSKYKNVLTLYCKNWYEKVLRLRFGLKYYLGRCHSVKF